MVQDSLFQQMLVAMGAGFARYCSVKGLPVFVSSPLFLAATSDYPRALPDQPGSLETPKAKLTSRLLSGLYQTLEAG